MWDFESVYLAFSHIVGKWSLNSLTQHDINPAQKNYTTNGFRAAGDAFF